MPLAPRRGGETERVESVQLWLLRAAWAVLPFAAGPAANDAIAAFDNAPRTLASVLLWAAWGVGFVATLAPRPRGLTLLRVVAPCLVLAAVAAAADGAASTTAAAGALAASVVASVLASTPAVAVVCAQGAAYGDERRYPLVTPPALFLGPLPLARLVTGAATVAGPLLVADGQLAVGVPLLVAAPVFVALAVRSLHALSRRWAVLVPAGLVLVDPLTLADPILFTRASVQSVQRATGGPRRDAVDLRLGAVRGSVVLTLAERAEVLRARRARRGGELVRTSEIRFATSWRRRLLADATGRRIYAASPPPTSASPS